MLFLILPLMSSSVSAQTFNASNYPAPLTVPSAESDWIKSFLEAKSKEYPRISQRGDGQSSDWSKDKTRCNETNTWAFTFDDGPSENTELALQALASVNKTGLFFVTGSQAVQYPQVLKKAADAGHEIGSHSWSHKALTTLTNGQIVAELVWTSKIIKEITGKTPTFMRPPYGDIDDRVRAVCRSLDLTPVIWNYDSDDWKSNESFDSSMVVDGFKEYIQQNGNKTGTISLQHDLSRGPSRQIKATLDEVIKAGYNVIPLSRCLGQSAFDDKMWASFPESFRPRGITASPTTGTNATPSASPAAPSPTSTVFKIFSGKTDSNPQQQDKKSDASDDVKFSFFVLAVAALVGSITLL